MKTQIATRLNKGSDVFNIDTFNSKIGVIMTSEYDFKKIYAEYYEKIVQYLVRITGPNDAEDIAQDVFDKINRGLDGFQGKSKLSTWIYRIATNTAIDRSRSAAFKHSTLLSNIEENVDLETQTAWAASKPIAVDQNVIRKEMNECVIEFIDNLPQDYRTVIVLSELEGLFNKEIAEILDISIENVKARLHRSRAKLKTALQDGCDFYRDEENVFACDRKQTQIFSITPK